MYRLPPAASGPGFRALLDYWIARFPTDAAAGRLPGRQHLDPAELPPRCLAHLLLLQVVPGNPRRYRFRVAGTAFSSIAGRDVTGLHYDEIGTAEQAGPVIAAFDQVVDRAAPVFLEGALSFPPDDHFWVQRLGLPLAQDGCNVDLVLALWVARRQSRADLAKAAAAAGADGGRPQLLERL